MNIFTTGYEFVGAITDMIIAILSSVFCYRLNQNIKNRKWVFFFLLIAISGLFGILIHGISFNKTQIKVLWLILSLVFSFAITTLVYIFINNKKYGYRSIIITSVIVYLIFFFEMLIGIDFLLTFIMYAALCILFCLIVLLKKGIKQNIYYIIGLVLQIIGGIPLLLGTRIKSLYIDENSIYHIFMMISIIFLYIGSYKNRWQK